MGVGVKNAVENPIGLPIGAPVKNRNRSDRNGCDCGFYRFFNSVFMLVAINQLDDLGGCVW